MTAPIEAALFDMDGVVTDTAAAHAASWKELFDALLKARSERLGEPFRPFDPRADYLAYVDGRPRFDGVRTFLASRGIGCPEGTPDDPPGHDTVAALGNLKNRYFNDWLDRNQARAFAGTVALVHALRASGIRTALFTSSRNADAVLRSAGVGELFDVRLDGNDLRQLKLPGKPDPALLLEAARRLGVEPGRTAVLEDASAGIAAGKAGGFVPVIGIDRGGNRAALEAAGADLVVEDAAELFLDQTGRLVPNLLDRLPLAFERETELRARLAGRTPAVFLDYDGTLTPIVEDPARAFLSDDMRAAMRELVARVWVAVVTGRDLRTIRRLVGIDGLHYAGSHGFEIGGPEGFGGALSKGEEALPDLDRAEQALRQQLEGVVAGAEVERERFALAIHYRRVGPQDVAAVEQAVDRVVEAAPGLKKGYGKKVFRLQPAIDWDKGHAVLYLLRCAGLEREDVLPVYLGDDLTDEDAFRTLKGRGLGICVRGEDARATSADYALEDVDDVRRFLELLSHPADGERA